MYTLDFLVDTYNMKGAIILAKSFCIKNNNDKVIHELISQIENINLDDICISNKKFAIYENVIVHYLGNNNDLFMKYFAKAITTVIIHLYQKFMLCKIINDNYFYFFDYEKKEILNICIDNINDLNLEDQFNSIYDECFLYINENKSMILDGFVRFRLYKYTKLLDELVNFSVNKYLVQREYYEFVRLLKEYISTNDPNCSVIHLIYSKTNVVLLNENKILIPIENNISNVKYLSDISFSKNDYCLNTLLNLLPSKIIMHILSTEDEFIETIKLIFSDRITICHSCELCTNSTKNSKSTM